MQTIEFHNSVSRARSEERRAALKAAYLRRSLVWVLATDTIGQGVKKLDVSWPSDAHPLCRHLIIPMDKAGSDGWEEAAFFASSPFLTTLAAFVRGRGRKNNEDVLAAFEAVNKPATLTSLSPEVLARLRLFPGHGEQPEPGSSDTRRAGSSTATTTAAAVGEDGAIDWSRVAISSSTEEDGTEALAEGARLAASCHAVLLQRSADSVEAPADGGRLHSARVLFPWVFKQIVLGSDEELHLALCVCLAVMEKALYGIYRQGVSDCDADNTVAGDERGEVAGDDRALGGGGGGGGDGTVAGPAMILRDLIATPQVQAALPKQMVAVLRLLLLPLGFNIRNLVWHGFLAPHELPRELGSLVLMVTVSIPCSATAQDRDKANLHPPATETSPPVATAAPGATTKGCCCSDAKDPSCSTRSARGVPSADQRLDAQGNLPQSPPPPPVVAQHQARCSGWALDSFDDRLACPPSFARAVKSLLSDQHRSELSALVRRTTFVFPGRGQMVLLALDALRKGQHVLFLVAVLPVLEHGLRCLFSCANDSPGHLFAYLRKYYSTLDGFGQRARHQLLLDQEMSGSPHRPNLLLASLGPGMSACLLDLFMMNAGPCVRGKVAHAEVDMSAVFKPISSSFSPSSDTTDDTENTSGIGNEDGREKKTPFPGVIGLATAAFLVLCSRYDPTTTRFYSTGSGGGDNGSNGSGTVVSSNFDDALVTCETLCAAWTPRFHPHELLEMDLRASWTAFDSLALALQRRAVSVERVPGREDLAVMSVCISRDCDDNLHVGTTGFDTGQDKTAQTSCGGDGGRVARKSENEGEKGDSFEKQPGRKDESPLLGSCAGLVLTVTDAAHRLLPPVAAVARREGSPSSPATIKGGRDSKKMKPGASATDGMFPTLLRANTALRDLNVALACRFKRLGRNGGNENGGPTSDGSSAGCACPVTPSPGDSCEAPPGVHPSNSARVSAFVVFMHAKRCPAVASCCLECRCLDDSASGRIGRDETRPDADGWRSRDQRQRQMITDSDHDCSGSDCIAIPATAPLARAKCKPGELNARISPPTNVVTAVPLPQIGCMGGICRACADIAGSLLHRIGELEALLASRTARSGQRRQYAVTLSVAPTLLRFLAAAMSAVEAFVLEWHVRRGDGIFVAQTSPDAAPGLTFLRRLAAAIGALSLCVLPGIGGAPTTGEQTANDNRGDYVAKQEGGVVTGGGDCSSNSSSSSSRSRSRMSSSGSGEGASRKGYVQALAELATFLETKTARQGFSGC